MCYAIEVYGPSRRAFAGAMVQLYFTLGYMLSSAIAYALPDWHEFTLCCALILIARLLLAWLFPESPSYLYAVGKYREGRKTLRTFAEKTNTSLDDEFFEQFEEHLKNKSASRNQIKENQTFTIMDLFRHREMGFVSINIAICFLVNTLVYYGFIFNVGTLSGSLYVNNVLNGLVDLMSSIFCMVFVDKIGKF